MSRYLGGRPRREQRLGPRPRAQLRGAGQVIGVRVRLDHEAQAEPTLFEVGQVIRDAVGTRVDQRRLARVGIRDEIRETALGAHLVHGESLRH